MNDEHLRISPVEQEDSRPKQLRSELQSTPFKLTKDMVIFPFLAPVGAHSSTQNASRDQIRF